MFNLCIQNQQNLPALFLQAFLCAADAHVSDHSLHQTIDVIPTSPDIQQSETITRSQPHGVAGILLHHQVDTDSCDTSTDITK